MQQYAVVWGDEWLLNCDIKFATILLSLCSFMQLLGHFYSILMNEKCSVISSSVMPATNKGTQLENVTTKQALQGKNQFLIKMTI